MISLTATTTVNILFDVLLGILAIMIGIYAMVVTKKLDIIENIPRLIKEAQLLTEFTGPEKMKWVIDNLIDELPKIFHAVFTKEVLEGIAQNIYNYMKEYRENWKKVESEKKE